MLNTIKKTENKSEQLTKPVNKKEELDLEELARKVVVLLMRELKLENERTGKG